MTIGKRNFIMCSCYALNTARGAKCKDKLSVHLVPGRLFAAQCAHVNSVKVDMEQATIWWVLTGAIVAVELLTGTFYLLMLSIGMVAGAIAAHLGASSETQLVAAAIVGGGLVMAWRQYKKSCPKALPAGANRDVILDVGEQVEVGAWAADGSSSVKYRGAQWSVSPVAGATPTPGLHRIVEVVGSRLMLEKV
jgi:membrane protein implicated in regulation of membrane protease activity